jgi:hypothetical protein
MEPHVLLLQAKGYTIGVRSEVHHTTNYEGTSPG